jgi:predicted ATPase/class 3 adenylate cyclase
MPDLPTGTVTFLFTDIEGSTNLARTLGPRWPRVLEEHNRILRSDIRDHGGIDVRTEGDAFFAVFTSAIDAVAASADAQRHLAGHAWPEDGPVRVRIGMHTGEGRLGGDEYVGLDVHRTARIAAAGHGGQVLISEVTNALATHDLPEGVAIRDLGTHRLKDFDEPQPIHQLVIDGLPHDFPALKTLEIPTNLPVQLTTFVGRDRELAHVEALLSNARLLTLVGPGGTGKTRLALEVAARRTEDYRDGVFFVDLSPIRDAGLVPSSIVQGLGLKEQVGRSALDTAARHLADRRALLILDNFEQVAAAAPVVQEILEAAPGSCILATSRIRLGLLGEREFPVPPLGVPVDRGDLGALSANEAMALFADRARAAQPSFEITQENADAIADVCARLDGLPLAIELAAAQLRVLSPAELLARLEHRLPLRTGAANVPERQRTLQAAIEWSHQLLDEPVRRLFAEMAVFAGGASFAAVEAVSNPDGDLGVDTLEALGSLVDHSLVRRDERPEGSRFLMLETIREYATDRLREGSDLEDVERRHAEFFAAVAAEWGPWVRSPKGPEAIRRLARDHANIREALDWSLRHDRVDVGSGIAASMWMFWVERGHLAEGRGTIERILGLPSAAARDHFRAAALTALGALVYWATDYQAAIEAYGEAADIRRQIGDARAVAQALTDVAYALLARADASAALPLIEESLQLARESGDDIVAMVASGLLGLARAQLGDYPEALAYLQGSLAELETIEAGGRSVRVWVGEWKGRIGSIFRLTGRLEDAEEALVESLQSGRRIAGNVAAATVTWQLAAVASERGDHDRALRLGGFSESMSERIGGSPPRALMLLPELETVRVAARSVMDDEMVDELWTAGRAMSADQAIAYAIGETK